MIDSAQTLLIGVVVVLTVLLAAVGVQVFLVLKEVRNSVRKMNKIIDDAGLISESVAKPIASLSNSITGISSLAGLFGWLAKKRKKTEESQTDE